MPNMKKINLDKILLSKIFKNMKKFIYLKNEVFSLFLSSLRTSHLSYKGNANQSLLSKENFLYSIDRLCNEIIIYLKNFQ